MQQVLRKYIRDRFQSQWTGQTNLLDRKPFVEFFNMSKMKFDLVIKSSSVTNAGFGVFLKGFASKGTIVSFYPGFYVPPLPVAAVLSSSGDFPIKPDMINSNHRSQYEICCNSIGGTLDSTEYFVKTRLDQYCHADLVNHPPLKVKPNVTPIDFLWSRLIDDIDSYLDDQGRTALLTYSTSTNSLHRGLWYVDGGTFDPVYVPSEGVPCGGIALVTTTDIEDGEELFMDYRYDPSDPELPEWYHPVSSV